MRFACLFTLSSSLALAGGCLAEFPPLVAESDGTGGSGGSDAAGCVVRVKVGGKHTCFLRTNGEVACFGRNEFGQLGDLTLEGPQHEPKTVSLPEAAVDIGLGSDHSCAVLESGRIFCWGSNAEGQIVDGQPKEPRPKEIAGILAERIVVGETHACAVYRSELWCFGSNEDNALTSFGGTKVTPIKIPLSRPVTEAAVGGGHSCALLDDGSIYCWGFNTYGAPGVSEGGNGGASSTIGEPTLVFLPTKAKAVAAGFANSCALLEDATLHCWGDPKMYKLADDLGGTAQPEPLAIVQLGTSAQKVRIGGTALAAQVSNDDWVAWGTNDTGIFANASVTSSRDPIPMNIDKPRDIALGATHACAITREGAVACWGTNEFGEIGLPPSSAVSISPHVVESCER